MKKIILLLLIPVIVVLACNTPKKVTYVFPVEMTAAVQASYTQICDKGKLLYDLNCAGCHTTKRGGKELIPDFTPEQLESYQIRIANQVHEPIMNDEQLPAEDLGFIMTFLTYKSKSGVAVAHRSVDRH
jgi:mono/diheme cytochrome c family protein